MHKFTKLLSQAHHFVLLGFEPIRIQFLLGNKNEERNISHKAVFEISLLAWLKGVEDGKKFISRINHMWPVPLGKEKNSVREMEYLLFVGVENCEHLTPV